LRADDLNISDRVLLPKNTDFDYLIGQKSPRHLIVINLMFSFLDFEAFIFFLSIHLHLICLELERVLESAWRLI